MKIEGDIITVGLAPAWDLTCVGNDLQWGDHPVLQDQVRVAAGKSLNVSRALAWLGCESTATGWWGQDDYSQMEDHVTQTCPKIRTHMTSVPGSTRINVTVLDKKQRRELHLRSAQSLASRQAFKTLQQDLVSCLRPNTVTVLAGALPNDSYKNQVLSLARSSIQTSDTRLIVDAHGPVYTELVRSGLPWLITPNVAELGELLDRPVQNRLSSLTKAARSLTDRVPLVLLSRGRLGALLVTNQGAWQGQCVDRGKVVSTVGCGDYLLAGFIAGLTRQARPQTALATALKCATARAWGWSSHKRWSTVKRQIRVQVEPV